MPVMHFEEDDEPLFPRDVGNNVVSLDSRRHASMPPTPGNWFAPRDSDEYHPEDEYIPGKAIPVGDPVNKALKLADQAGFMQICEKVLWDESEREQFGELLRGLVIEFEPRNTFHLHLLANIADAQWNLKRLQGYRQTAFQSGSSTGRFGMAAGTDFGLDEIGRVQRYMAYLTKSIDTYKSVYEARV